MAEERPLLSIIVTTYCSDRLPDVLDLMDSLEAQTYPRIEILFVAERIPEFCKRVREYAEQRNMRNVVTLFNDGEPGLSAARNVAIPEAKGELIAFLDDDVVAFPHWAEAIVGTFGETDAVGLTGRALPLWEDPGMEWFPKELYWIISCTDWSGWDRVREVRYAWGMNMAFRKEAFSVAGLFHSATGYHKGPFAEDNEFSLRVRSKTGKRILYVPDVTVWHKVHRYRLSLRFVRERAYWIGRSRRNLSRFDAADGGAGNLSIPERDLLGRIITRRIPSDLAGLARTPSTALKRLILTAWALIFVALGYCSQLLPGRNVAKATEDFSGGEV